jgi:hypothetical protein
MRQFKNSHIHHGKENHRCKAWPCVCLNAGQSRLTGKQRMLLERLRKSMSLGGFVALPAGEAQYRWGE